MSSKTVLSSPVAVHGHAARAWLLCAGVGLCFGGGTLAGSEQLQGGRLEGAEGLGGLLALLLALLPWAAFTSRRCYSADS